MNKISLKEAKERYKDFRYIIKEFDQIQVLGIHGSLTMEANQYSKDADYIIMLKEVTKPIGIDTRIKKTTEKIAAAICGSLNAIIHNTYVCENLNLIGHSILIKNNKKLSFHFVSLDFCKKSLKSLMHPEQKIDCIFGSELFPTRVYRLWVRDTITLLDKNHYLEEMKRFNFDNYHLSIRPYIVEHLKSSMNQYSGCIDKAAEYLLKHSVINAAVLLVYSLNYDFFGSPKKLLTDLNHFEIEKGTSQVLKKLFQNLNSDDLFNELIVHCKKTITKV